MLRHEQGHLAGSKEFLDDPDVLIGGRDIEDLPSLPGCAITKRLSEGGTQAARASMTALERRNEELAS